MPTINLLPWRDEYQDLQNKKFFILTGLIVILTIAIYLAINFFLKIKIEQLNADINYLSLQGKSFEQKIIKIKDLLNEKEKLRSKILIVQTLEKNRNFAVQILESLSRAIPDGLYLTCVKKNKLEIVIKGKMDSNNRLSRFIENIESLNWVSSVNLKKIVNLNESTKTGVKKGKPQTKTKILNDMHELAFEIKVIIIDDL